MSEKINEENKTIWNANADYWNERMGLEGNDYHLKLILPTTIELLDLDRNSKILDIGCGNGIFARKMSSLGMQVTAFDFAEKNIENAKSFPSEGIDYRVLDATVFDDLMQLGENKYDGATANMVLMDMPNIEVLFRALRLLLKDNGVFVFSILHPCFNNNENAIIENDSIRVLDYHQDVTTKGEAITNQPQLQYYFHRSISTYFKIGFKYGFVVSGVEEPVFDKKKKTVFSKIPPILIVRMERN